LSELAQTISKSWIALAALAGLCACAFGVLLRLRLRAGAEARSAAVESLVDVAAGASIAFVLVLTFAPTGQYQARQVHLLPISDLFQTAASRGVLDALAQSGGNVALFVPVGLLVPLRWPRLDHWRNAVAAAALFSAAIEVVQFVAGSGHTTSADDVMMNTLGGVVGLALSRAVRRTLHRREARAGAVSDPSILDRPIEEPAALHPR
jgi:hypothetical protein